MEKDGLKITVSKEPVEGSVMMIRQKSILYTSSQASSFQFPILPRDPGGYVFSHTDIQTP